MHFHAGEAWRNESRSALERELLDFVVEAGDQDSTGLTFDAAGYHLDQLRQRIADHATGDAGMKIVSGGAERETKWLHAAESGRTAGFTAGDPDRIGHDN